MNAAKRHILIYFSHFNLSTALYAYVIILTGNIKINTLQEIGLAWGLDRWMDGWMDGWIYKGHCLSKYLQKDSSVPLHERNLSALATEILKFCCQP